MCTFEIQSNPNIVPLFGHCNLWWNLEGDGTRRQVYNLEFLFTDMRSEYGALPAGSDCARTMMGNNHEDEDTSLL